MSMRTTDLIPVPRRRALGGTPVLVAPATLRDIAALQGILDDLVEDPLARLDEILGEADPEIRRQGLVSAYELAEQGSPVYGDGRSVAFFRTPTGKAVRMSVILERHQPSWDMQKIAGLATKAPEAEIDSILRVFHAVDPIEVLESILLGIDSTSEGSKDFSWGKAIDALSQERGWPYHVIYDLTLTEYANAVRSGEPPQRGRELKPGEDPLKALEEQNLRFYGSTEGQER